MVGLPDRLAALAQLVAPGLPTEPTQLAATHLQIAGELIARRAPRSSSARQYAFTYSVFCTWLQAELGRPPLVADLTADTAAAYARHLETRGGRGGGRASAATRRQRLVLIRALARQLGLETTAAQIQPLRHRTGPPETLTEAEYGNLIRAPDGRTRGGRRDRAMLRILGDCGLRNAELRNLTGRSLRRPRANSRHHSLFIVGKGDVERQVELPQETYDALHRWLEVHPDAGPAGKLSDHDLLFVPLANGGRGSDRADRNLSDTALAKLVARHARAAGIPQRLAHPHALRSYYATSLASESIPVQRIAAHLGHASIQSTSGYLADTESRVGSVGDVLDRRHQAARSGRSGRG